MGYFLDSFLLWKTKPFSVNFVLHSPRLSNGKIPLLCRCFDSEGRYLRQISALLEWVVYLNYLTLCSSFHSWRPNFPAEKRAAHFSAKFSGSFNGRKMNVINLTSNEWRCIGGSITCIRCVSKCGITIFNLPFTVTSNDDGDSETRFCVFNK